MKNTKLALASVTLVLILTSTMFLSNAVNAGSMNHYMKSTLIDVCKAAKSNNTIRFTKTVDSYRLKTQTVALKVVCNGDNISDFAMKHDANATANRLNESLGDISIEDVALNNQEKLHVNF